MMEENNGFVKPMLKDPLVGFDSTNTSVLRPYGVWLVISPFNFPFALTGGPTGAALVAGNTVVIKPASDTAWIVRLFVECLRDAGIPNGVVNFVTGPGSTLGQALVDSPEIDGATFTGSFDVGMKLYRDFANRNYIRPVILELGGKNPAIVSKNANLEDAATGIYRSAFGLQGQKCSAASRVLVEEAVYDELVSKLKEKVDALVIGDPTERATYLGPVINQNAYNEFKNYMEEINQAGAAFLTGGNVKSGGMYDKGFYCEPTFVTNLPYSHRLWKHEMFLPISMIGKVSNLDEAMQIANDVNYGLTAGFYGSQKETDWFFDNIQAGVTYANRPQGATTGAWPGYQPFGGWKGSGASGKNGGGYYYVQLYMHEQIQTSVKHAPVKAKAAKKKAVVKKKVVKKAKKSGKKK
jgi:1-pyrroline-5-carboxylate dehydrogenase